MSSTLYIQTDKNVEIHSPNVYLSDLAKVSGSDSALVGRCLGILILSIPDGKPGRYVVSATDIVRKVQGKEKQAEITHMGEPTFVLTYEKEKHQHKLWSCLKAAFVCLVTFFGAGFSIMTFNTDVDTTGLFSKVYEQFTGRVSDGFTELEIMYSLGIGIGVVFFFNHFGKWKITEDPTPMEVQMRVYEDDVDQTIIEKNGREGQG